MNFISTWRASLQEFTKLKTLVLCGVLAALGIVLGFTTSISLGPYVRIGFSGLPNQVVDYLFGPCVGAIFSGALDILKYLVKPTGPFFPGFTISAVCAGIVYGYAFYRKEVSIVRVFIAELIVKVAVNIGLNTLWLNMLYNKAILAILPGRILSNAIMLPIDTLIGFALLKFTRQMLLKMVKD